MLKERLLTVAVLLPLLLGLMFYAPNPVWGAAIGIAMAVAAVEWARLCRLEKAGQAAFAALVAKMSNDFGKALSLPSIFRTLNMVPVLSPDTCNEPAKLRALSEQSIAGFENILEKLLPMIDTVSEVSKSDG